MTEEKRKILIIDDNADVLQAVRMLLKKHVELVHTELDPGHLHRRLSEHEYDLILLDMNFARGVSSGEEGLSLLREVLEVDPDAVVVMITAYGDIEIAVDSIKTGAFDFVVKPWQNEKLLATVLAGLKHRRSRRELDRLKGSQRALSDELNEPFAEIVGQSMAVKKLLKEVERVATTDVSILITGENGTGKELIAREIHRLSHRANEVFVKVDVGSLSESLFESELFGHIKGAFTGARGDRVGRFEIASGGTLFLDEIANIPPSLQVKLLTTLDQHEVTRVGSNTPRRIDIRLISATNHAVHELVEAGDFRQDLLYRINTVEIHLPPLRERSGDILILAEFFLRRFAGKYRKDVSRFSRDAEQSLLGYHWPGNVRELQHVIERAVIMASGTEIRPVDIARSSSESDSKHSKIEGSVNLEALEKSAILDALKASDGNVSKASSVLGLTRASLYRRMKKHGI